MQTVEGIVTKVIKTPSKYGRGFLWTVLLADDTGREHGIYYNFGDTKPPCAEGDRVRMGVESQGPTRAKFVPGTGEVLARGVGAPQPGGNDGKTREARGGYYDDTKRQQSIAYQSSRKDALELLKIALEREAIPLGQSKSKRMDELKKLLRKLTAELYLDLQDVEKSVKDADVTVPQPDDPGKVPEDIQQSAANDEIDVSDADVEPQPAATGGGKF